MAGTGWLSEMVANSMIEREPACVTELTWRPTDLASSRSWSRVRSRLPTTKLMRTSRTGGSKVKAARIANAAAARGRSSVGKKGGKSGSYEDWTVDDLQKRAKELGLAGYSGKHKSELVSMLRDHWRADVRPAPRQPLAAIRGRIGGDHRRVDRSA